MAAPQEQPLHKPRRNHRRRDVSNELNDADLIKRYRFDREGILYVTSLVRISLCNETSWSNPLTPEMKVIITLHYFATDVVVGLVAQPC